VTVDLAARIIGAVFVILWLGAVLVFCAVLAVDIIRMERVIGRIPKMTGDELLAELRREAQCGPEPPVVRPGS
jgi:hypothetical protein